MYAILLSRTFWAASFTLRMRRARKSSMLHTMRGGQADGNAQHHWVCTVVAWGMRCWMSSTSSIWMGVSMIRYLADFWVPTNTYRKETTARTAAAPLLKTLNRKPRNMKAASIVNEAYFVEQWKRLRKQLKPIAIGYTIPAIRAC